MLVQRQNLRRPSFGRSKAGAACAAWAASWLALLPPQALAGDAAEGDAPSLKLTFGHYQLQHAAAGTDINLRWRRDGRSLWLGFYRDADFGQQLRLGWDDQWALPSLPGMPGLPLLLLPSLQLASRGFVGGSLAVQAGAPIYLQLGLGRTNLRPYANLNFDPNDALSAALGWQGEGGRQLALSVIADDRLHTGQQHHHLTLRWPVPAGLRLSADLLHKQGQGDGGSVNAWGWTLGLDSTTWFARVARDPKQNFSAFDAWRVSVGWRF